MVRWGHGEGGGVTAQGGHCNGAGPGFDAELLSAPQCGGGGTSAHPSAAFRPSFTAIRAVVHRSEKPPPNRGVGGGVQDGPPSTTPPSLSASAPPPDSHGCSDGVTALTSEPNRDVTPHPVTTPHPPHPGDVSSHNYDIDLPLRRWDGGVGGNSSAGGAAWGHRRSRCWGGVRMFPGGAAETQRGAPGLLGRPRSRRPPRCWRYRRGGSGPWWPRTDPAPPGVPVEGLLPNTPPRPSRPRSSRPRATRWRKGG